MIIVFSGTDGAGKSTQIGSLISEFENNHRVKYFWVRGGYTPLFMSLKRIVRLLLGHKVIPQGRNKGRDAIITKGWVSKLWLGIAILDMLAVYALYLRLLDFMGYVVFCDRYLGDSYIDFKENFGTRFNDKGILWRTLCRLVPTPDVAFLLHVPIEVSIKRSQLKNDPFPDSSDTLDRRLSSYLNEDLFPADVYLKIDCSRPIDEVRMQLRNKLESVLI